MIKIGKTVAESFAEIELTRMGLENQGVSRWPTKWTPKSGEF
jgi:hypothetical protein